MLRWARRFRLFDAGNYTRRNHWQYNLVMLATLVLFVVELGLVVPGLPANRPIYRDSDKMVRWESEYLNEGRLKFLGESPCIVAPVLDGPNLKSESTWSYCLDTLQVPSSFAQFPPDRLELTVSNPETVKGYLLVSLNGESFIIQSRYSLHISMNNRNTARAELSDNATTLIRNLQRNFDLLRDFTGLTLTLLPGRTALIFGFLVNASQVRRSPGSSSERKTVHADFWVRGIIQGILTLRTNGTGSQLYENVGSAVGPKATATKMEKTKILVGAYIGTLVPAFYVVAITAGTVLVYFIVCIFLSSPAGGAWELLQAHGRDHEDRILAGPPGDVIDIQANG